MAGVCVTLYPTTVPLPLPATGAPRTSDELACLGVGFSNLEQWKSYWVSGINCPRLFNELMYPPGPGKRRFSLAGFQQVTDDFEYMFAQYFSKSGVKGGHTIAVPGQTGYDNFQEVLIDACTQPQFAIQGACQTVTAKMCASCSREEILSNADLLRLCGCSVPPLDPEVYGGITPECDPLCAQATVSKKRNPITGDVAQCNATICVINNVSITAAKSTVGGILFTQVCNQCNVTSSTPCKCIVDASIPTIAQAVGLTDPVIFRQKCGPNSLCLTVNNATGVVTPIPCENAIQPLKPRTFKFAIPTAIWIVAAVLIVIGVLVILAALYAGHHPDTITTPVLPSSSSGSSVTVPTLTPSSLAAIAAAL